ncbi:uncharacterized protein METZ01_LOCUS263910, partial [marine metagenome]
AGNGDDGTEFPHRVMAAPCHAGGMDQQLASPHASVHDQRIQHFSPAPVHARYPQRVVGFGSHRWSRPRTVSIPDRAAPLPGSPHDGGDVYFHRFVECARVASAGDQYACMAAHCGGAAEVRYRGGSRSAPADGRCHDRHRTRIGTLWAGAKRIHRGNLHVRYERI